MRDSLLKILTYGAGGAVGSLLVCQVLFAIGFTLPPVVLFIFFYAIFVVGRKMYNLESENAPLKRQAIWAGALLPLLYYTWMAVVWLGPTVIYIFRTELF